MKQSPLALGHTSEYRRPSNDRYRYAFINRACLTLALTLTLTGAWFALKGVLQTSHRPALSLEQIKPKAFSDTQIEENTSAGPQPVSTHAFYQIEMKREARNQRFYAHNRAQGFGLHFTARAASLTANEPGPDADIANGGKGTRVTAAPEVVIQFAGAGYGDRIRPASGTPAMSGQGDRFTYTHQLAPENQSSARAFPLTTVEEWFLNRPEGIEQGFTLSSPPNERRAGEPLRLGMDINEKGLRLLETADHQGVVLQRQGQGSWLKYNQLKVTDADGCELAARMKVEGQRIWFEISDENAIYPLTIDPVWTRVTRMTSAEADAKATVSFSVDTVGGAEIVGSSAPPAPVAPQLKRFDNWNDVFASEEATNDRSSNALAYEFLAAPSAPPNLTLSGTCDTFGNSAFTIKNLGGAMTTNYTWEIYQNNVFLTNGTFLLTAAGTSGDTQSLTINGLYGNIGVKVKNGTTSSAVEILSTTAFCVERPTVFVRQASGQTDPTTSTPIKFAATFSKAVTGFSNADVKITGMAATPGITVTDSGDHANYTIAITGMADGETVSATIPQDSAFDTDGIGNRISTYLGGDHTVTYHAPPNLTLTGSCDLFANSAFTIKNIGGAMTTNYTWEIYQENFFLTNGTFSLTKAGTAGDTQTLTINGLYGNITVAVRNGTTPAAVEILRTTAFCVDSSPTVTINQASTQSDPTNASPINFAVVFNTPVSGFINTDVHITGMAGTPVKTVTDSGDHMHFNVAVTGMADGETVTASLFAGAAFYLGHSDIFSKASTSTDNHVTYDTSRPTVTVNQASGQADPTDVSPIHFDVMFSEPITGFTSADLDVAGVHGTPGVTLTDSGDHKHFSAAVTGMINNDRVTARLLSGKVSDAAGNLNLSSTSTDNSVTFSDTTPPSVTVEQKSGQADPVNTGPIHFTATFSEPIDITTLSSGDITVGGTAGATTAFLTEIAPNDHTTFDISVTGMTVDGTVTASIAANKLRDVNGNLNTASTSTDNTVTYDATPPTVTIDQMTGQNDPADNSPINFKVVFSEPVSDFDDATDVTLSGTAGANKISITGGPTIYNVAVSGMTSDGTVIVNIPANVARDAAQNLNVASTSTDNTVTFNFCAANPIVTSTADSGPNTLREALAKVCAAPNNNISFDLGGPGANTITLTSGQLDIQKSVNITNTVTVTNGPLTIDGNNASRVFINEAGVTTTIGGITITNGNHNNLPNPGGTGSGIRNDGTLTLQNVLLTGNHLVAQGEGGAVYNTGSLTLIDSTISNNVGDSGSLGAGIDSTAGSVSMSNCTVNGNTGAGQGGGIRNSGGTFTILNSTITANAAIDGAAIYNDATGTLSLTSSTISRNTASGSGGGLYNLSGGLNLRNSIVALNTATSAGPDISGSATSQGFNLIGNGTDATIAPTTGDQIGSAGGGQIDPLLDILGNYGGPTQTMRLLTGSPAIDQGDSSSSALDQRGLSRPVDQPAVTNAASGDGADIGAYEMSLTPEIAPGGPTTFCAGDSVTLTSSSPNGNQWFLNGSPIIGETNQSYVATASGNYTVEVNNVISIPTVVTVNPFPATPTITPGGPTTFCAGGSVTLTSSSSNGNQWYLNGNPINGATNNNYVANASGDYTVVNNALGCASPASAPATITVNPLPATPTITAQGPTTFCDDDNVILSSNSASGNQWYLNGNPIGGATDQDYIATAPGNYTVVMTANGCDSAPSSPTTVTVNPTPSAPIVTPGGPTTFCVGGSVTLASNRAGGNQWYLNGIPIGGATGQTYVATASGDYTDTMTSTGCTSASSAPISVTASPIPATPTITPGGSTTFCDGSSVTLTSSSANGNQWFLNGNEIDGAHGQTYTAIASGNYTVTVTESGCTAPASAPISVTVNPIPPAPSITPGGPTTFCDGGSVTLTSNSASGNQWYLDGNLIHGATSQTYIATAGGNYTDTVTALNCASAASTSISVTVNPIPPAPSITPGGPTTFCDGGTVTLKSSSANGNQWYLDSSPITGATNQTYIANASGNYTVTATESDCTSPASTATTVTIKPSALTVINTNDSGPGSLRQAIADICDGGTIGFNLGTGPHTIVLNSELSIVNTVTIANALSATNGAVTLSGNNSNRVFNLDVPSPGVVNLYGLNISNGSGGAGNGGGVLNNHAGTLNILDSTLSGNAAASGGAVHNNSTGVINITNSTISLNSAQVVGGGISNAQSGAINITNSTLSHNTANGQGGAIFNSGNTAVQLRNSIVAVNTAAVSGPDLSGVFASFGHNLIGQNDGSTGFAAGSVNANGDLVGISATPLDPRLGPLQNNGGGTQTRVLLSGSPALDAGDNCVTEATHCGDSNIGQLSTDQRGAGFARILDAAAGDSTPTIDIGAVEVGPSVEDITDKTTAEDTPLTFIFKVGDGASAFDSVTATSGNTTLVPNANLTIGPDTASTRSLSITPAPDQTGTSTITVTVTKTIGVTLQSMSDTFVLTVTPVNDKPVNTVPGPQSVIENGSLALSASGHNQITVSDLDAGSSPLAVSLSAINGALTLNGTAGLTFTPPSPANDGNADSLLSFEGTIANINTALNGMVFTPTPGYSGPASIQIQTSDKGATGSGGLQVVTDTINIAVLSGGTLAFSAPTFTVNEAAGTATITVGRTGGSSGEARVSYATGNGTALAGAGNDYLSASGQLIFPDGVITRTFTITINNDVFNEPSETVNLTLTSPEGSATLGTPNTAVLTILDDDPAGGYIKFSSANYNVAEGGAATITVERVGSVAQPATVDYATAEDTGRGPCSPAPGNTIASSRCDFNTGVGRLSFAAGDGSPKTFTVLINQDSYVEGPESLLLSLSNLTGGAAFASPSTATLTIIDDDLTAPATNVIDDPTNFVRQHYHDFLNREPDPTGLAFWTSQISSCGNNAQCIELKRINVSAAFFLSTEFQATGGTAYLTNKVAYGGLPNYLRFETDLQAIGRNYVFGQPGAENILEANKVAYFKDFVSRTDFMNTYNGLADQTYVNTLILNTGVEFTQPERDALLNGLANHTETRATVLRKISEKPGFAQAEFSRMFVLMEYFGYLRRSPNEGDDTDSSGYDFWLRKLNQFNGNFVDAEMVKAFINSIEYRRRFGP